MIKIFRKIRQQLLSQNRFSKYFLYAVGEIFLVMVGILLALQVNNWNEQRKTEQLKNIYKLSLREDLVKDTLYLNNTLNEMKIELKNLLEISERLSTGNLSADSTIKIYRHEFNSLFSADITFNRNTIEGLLNTGNINLFEKDVYNALMTLNGLHGNATQTVNVNIGFYINYSTRVNIPFNDELSAIKGEALQSIWQGIDKSGFLRDFAAKLSSKILGYQIIIRKKQELLKQTKLTLNLLLNDND